jgi:hypothetical protein
MDTWTNNNTTRSLIKKWYVIQRQHNTCASRKLTCGTTGTDTWSSKNLKRARTRDGATLCNKKVTRTQIISNATGCSMKIWKASPTKAPASVAAPLPRISKQIYNVLFFVTVQATSMMICKNRHRSSSMTRLLWRTIFHHKFVIELKLWWIWLLQWWKLFVIEVDVSNIVCGLSNSNMHVISHKLTSLPLIILLIKGHV